MFNLFKRMFAVAEVDGITFWSKNAFNDYMLKKKRDERGLKQYTFRAVGERTLSKCISILEKRDIFDYSVEDVWGYSDVYNVNYWANHQIIEYKE